MSRCEEVGLGVDRNEVEQRPDSLLDLEKSPDRDDHVDQAEGERIGARRGARREQTEQAGGEMQQVVPAVDREDSEDALRGDRGAGIEARFVEEADDPPDRQRAPARVQ